MPKILSALQNATMKEDVLHVLDAIESAGISIDWRPVGDRARNYPTIHMTHSPIASLVERVTNAIDATFEKYAEQFPKSMSLRSPRIFAEEIVGFTDGLLDDSVKRRKKYSADTSGIIVGLWDGDDESTPTIDISDNGVGLTREEFPTTILSLNESNKITKWYLMGQYGQGGSTTLAFSEYTIIVSKRFDDTNGNFAFTIVKRLPRANDEKSPTYVYMVSKEDGLPLFATLEKSPSSTLPHFNTLVRHINYAAGKQNLFSLYNKLHYFLFDPVIPFKIINHKITEAKHPRLDDEDPHERAVFGSRSRLNRTPLLEMKDEIVYPLKNPDLGDITLRYWLFKRGTDDSQKETFIDPDYPIVITYYGQSHETMPRRFLNECKLPYVQRDLVIQVDCDAINDAGRDAFFPSTRESITDKAKSIIRKLIVEIISGSGELRKLNRQREEASFTEGFAKEREDMRRSLAEMIDRIMPGRIVIKGGDRGEGDKKPSSPVSIDKSEEREEEIEVPESITIRNFPTFIKIMNKANPIVFRSNQTTRIEIFSDAPNHFLAKNGLKFSLSEEAEKCVYISHYRSDFEYGRAYLAARASENVAPFTNFNFTVRLDALSKSAEKIVFEDSRPALVEEPILRKEHDKSHIQTDAPYPVGIDRTHAHFVDNKWDEHSVAEVVESSDKTVIYVSLENQWYVGAIRKSAYSEQQREFIKNRYVLLTAFHAYLLDDYVEKLADDNLKQLYDKTHHAQLEIAVRTILTSLTSEKAYSDNKNYDD